MGRRNEEERAIIEAWQRDFLPSVDIQYTEIMRDRMRGVMIHLPKAVVEKNKVKILIVICIL